MYLKRCIMTKKLGVFPLTGVPGRTRCSITLTAMATKNNNQCYQHQFSKIPEMTFKFPKIKPRIHRSSYKPPFSTSLSSTRKNGAMRHDMSQYFP